VPLGQPGREIAPCLGEVAPVVQPAQLPQAIVVNLARHLVERIAQEVYVTALPAAADGQPLGDFSCAEPFGYATGGPERTSLAPLVLDPYTCRQLWPFAKPSRCRSCISLCSNAASALIDVSGNAIPSNLASKPRQVP
jgi:hypothetical protein